MTEASENDQKRKGFETGGSESANPPDVERTNHLLVIAIDEYEQAPLLNNCVRDARGVMEVLIRKYAFARENVRTLFNKEATGENIIRTLEELPEKLQQEDNLLIFFSGHGEYRSPQEEGFWVPVDARMGVTKDRISVPELKMYLNPLPCYHVVLVVDACFSGSIFKRYRSTGNSNVNLGKASRWGLTSGRLEPVLDGRPGMHSPFAESLIKQLNANNSLLRVDQLYANIVADLQQLGFEEQAPDSGYLDLSGNKRGMFFFQPGATEKKEGEAIDFSIEIDRSTLHIIEGDIVTIQADAIVSSDDTQLTMSGGVSAAIRRAAGPQLAEAVRKHPDKPFRVGDVVETAAFDLEANYIFHAITLNLADRSFKDDLSFADNRTIAAMTRRCLELAEERRLRHIVFPAIGTGAAGASFEETARAMINAICGYLVHGSSIDTVTIALYSRNPAGRREGLLEFYQKAILQGAAWSKLDRYQEELPEILRVLNKDNWTGELMNLWKKLLDHD